ncbi:MAG: putative lipid II flippase FtsW [Agathobacter sp.]|nr:putative lipid II flippase FtsW [Agathobacter sp.]
MAKQKTQRKRAASYFDYNMLFILIVLIGFGLVMLYSSSSYTATNKFGDSAYYLRTQIKAFVLGLVPMIFFIAVDYRVWKKFGILIYLMSFLLCFAVFIPGLGVERNNSTRWIKIGPIQFQPSEFAKLAIIIFLAMVIDRIPKQMNKTKNLLKVLVMLIPICGVIAYSNLSTAIIVVGIAVCMLFVASPKYKPFFGIAAGGVAFVVLFISLATYRGGRIEAWLHPETAGDKGYQTMQGLYAIGSGKLFGKGLGASLQKLGNVPESMNDMIFTIICEELGLFGAICVILLYILLLWRMMVIANNARDLFGSLLVTGVMSHIAIQVILNIAVVTNTIPNTGVTLPFISYGGTSVVFLMSEMGLVLGVSRGIRLETMEE